MTDGQSILSLDGRGRLRRATCKRCGSHDVAWTQSAKTGRWYLCRLLPNRVDHTTDTMRAYPWLPHKCEEVAR